jgi:low affinity Fe/Cu permease
LLAPKGARTAPRFGAPFASERFVASARSNSTARAGTRTATRHSTDRKGAGPIGEKFHRLAAIAAHKFGSPWAFFAAIAIVIGWAVTGPFFDFNETWQLVINTGTTIVTFLMVFLIQATQNRDALAFHLKLDELIRSSKARNFFADIEDASEEELEAFHREFERLSNRRSRGRRIGERN